MAKQAAAQPAIPVPAIAPRASSGAPISRVTGAAGAGEVPQGGGGRAAPPMQPDAAVQQVANTARVVQWGNGGPKGAKMDDETPVTASLTDQTGGTEGAAGKPIKVPKDRDEPVKVDDEEDPPAAAAKKDDEPPPPAARRGAALANLEAERKARELETTVKELQKRLEGVEPVAKSIKEGTLVQRVKALGLSKAESAELLEKLLVKDPELEGEDKPAAPAKKSPEVEALEATVAELKRRLDDRDGDEGNARIQRAEANIANDLKDAPDLPMILSEVPATITEDGKQVVVTPYRLVLLTAHQMWMDSGKNGSSLDYVKKAATNVEAHLRERNPKLAARLDAQKTTQADPPPVTTSPSLGKRTGKGAPSAEPKLPRDRDARDAEIKRQFGW
jgi:hypothetical protein